jgi:hypothetical protein
VQNIKEYVLKIRWPCWGRLRLSTLCLCAVIQIREGVLSYQGNLVPCRWCQCSVLEWVYFIFPLTRSVLGDCNTTISTHGAFLFKLCSSLLCKDFRYNNNILLSPRIHAFHEPH